MWSFAKFAILCVIAVAVGLVAVSLPIEGRTPAEYVRGLFETHLAKEKAKPQPAPKPVRAASQPAKAAPVRKADNPPADHPTDEERAGLERLLGEKAR